VASGPGDIVRCRDARLGETDGDIGRPCSGTRKEISSPLAPEDQGTGGPGHRRTKARVVALCQGVRNWDGADRKDMGNRVRSGLPAGLYDSGPGGGVDSPCLPADLGHPLGPLW